MPLFFFLCFEDFLGTEPLGIIVVESLNKDRHPFHINGFLQKQAKNQCLWKFWVFEMVILTAVRADMLCCQFLA